MKVRVGRKKRSLAKSSAESISSAAQSTFVQRLQILIERRGSVLGLATSADLSNSSIHLWLSGSEPSREKLVKLADAAGVSIAWLAAGRGPMRADLLPEGYALVRRYKAESKVEYEGVDYLALKREWIRSLPGAPTAEALLLTEATGDAMTPTIKSGDLILVNTSDRKIRDGIWALTPTMSASSAAASGLPSIVIRRVRSEGRGNFRLLCDNKDFKSSPTQIAHTKDDDLVASDFTGEWIVAFRSLGRVIWRAGRI
jgi:phage repressor protein C with HTH and peptisase S24 domain